MTRTLDEIRREGVAALRERLGRAGMIRFLQQFDLGRGDYASQRREWTDRTSLSTLEDAARKPRKPSARRKR